MSIVWAWFDLDNVLRSTNPYFHNLFKEKYPNKYVLEYNKMRTPNVPDCVNEEDKTLMWELLCKKDIFLQPEPNRKAIDVFRSIAKLDGVQVGICTSPLTRNTSCKRNNPYWISKYIGFPYNLFPFLRQTKEKVKDIGKGILIDDKIDIKDIDGSEVNLIVAGQPWNKNFSGPRIKEDWSNAEEIIRKEIEKMRSI